MQPQSGNHEACLYLVATPIGNLEDITLRALRILKEVDQIACEDTRHTQKLLQHYGIQKPLVSYHEHNELTRAPELVVAMEQGAQIALVSDAGVPLVSDPGYRLVTLCLRHRIPVIPIPGPSALLAALSASGLPNEEFLFAGFLPSRSSARRAKLEALRSMDATLIFYEAPHRIAAALRDAADILGNRRGVVARELTKLHEELVRGRLNELAANFSDRSKTRGEIVLLIDGASASDIDQGLGTASMSQALAERIGELEHEGLNDKAALKKAARELGLKRDEAYRLMLTQKNRRSK